MTTKKLLLWLSIATAIGTILGVVGKMAYDRGCEVQKVEQVSKAQIEQYLDIKEIKTRVGTIETNAAVTANKVTNIEDILNRWLVPKQVAEIFNNGR